MDMLGDFIENITPIRDGDTTDRLNFYVTTMILLGFSTFISGWEYVGNPIECWFPAYYVGNFPTTSCPCSGLSARSLPGLNGSKLT